MFNSIQRWDVANSTEITSNPKMTQILLQQVIEKHVYTESGQHLIWGLNFTLNLVTWESIAIIYSLWTITEPSNITFKQMNF